MAETVFAGEPWGLVDGSLWVHRGRAHGPRAGRPVAAFDFDSTLRRWRGRGPASDAEAVELLKALGLWFDVAIFTNRGTPDFPEKLAALGHFVAELEAAGTAVAAHASVAHDAYRKPQVGAWRVFMEERPALRAAARAASFFCGDAAGRASDFSASDRNFARNLGLRFLVPEQVFLSASIAKAQPLPPGDPFAEVPLAPRWDLAPLLAEATTDARRAEYEAAIARAADADVVIMMGSPGSGKSAAARRIAAAGGHTIVCRDDHAGAESVLRAYRRALAAGARVVLDGTHRNVMGRAAALGCLSDGPERKAVVVHVTTPRRLCEHLDGVRCHRGEPHGRLGRAKTLPPVALGSYWKRFQAFPFVVGAGHDEPMLASGGRPPEVGLVATGVHIPPDSDAARLRFA